MAINKKMYSVKVKTGDDKDVKKGVVTTKTSVKGATAYAKKKQKLRVDAEKRKNPGMTDKEAMENITKRAKVKGGAGIKNYGK
jgi:hypothetical protein